MSAPRLRYPGEHVFIDDHWEHEYDAYYNHPASGAKAPRKGISTDYMICECKEPSMNDLVRLAIDRAVRDFGDKGDGLFNAAGFGLRLGQLAGIKGGIDGHVVRAILTGRPDVAPESDGAHYRRLASR